jgi:segregation and condensation protein A
MDLYALMRTFKRIWERHHEKLQRPQHVIQKYPYTTEEVKEIILDRVGSAGRQDFVSLVLERGERIYVVFCFLAILELVQMQRVRIRIGQGFNNFWVEAKPEGEAAPLPSEEEAPAQAGEPSDD